MTITHNVIITVALTDADKAWLATHVVAPIVAALDGIRDAAGSQEEFVASLKAMQADASRIDPQTQR